VVLFWLHSRAVEVEPKKLWMAEARAKKFSIRGREPMAHKPDVALLMMASGSLDIFSTQLL